MYVNYLGERIRLTGDRSIPVAITRVNNPAGQYSWLAGLVTRAEQRIGGVQRQVGPQHSGPVHLGAALAGRGCPRVAVPTWEQLAVVQLAYPETTAVARQACRAAPSFRYASCPLISWR